MHNSSKRTEPLKATVSQETHHKGPRGLSRAWLWAVLMAVVAGAAGLSLTLGWFSPRSSPSTPQVIGEQWRVSIGELQEGKASHFQHKLADHTTVRFFLIRSSDGTFRAALDACDVCWPQGKGYVQEGDHMVCRNCGRRFPSQSIGMKRGGCNPHPLPYRLEGKHLVIRLLDLQEGERYFRLAGGTRS